jgi:AcrR family transcriptional regulator
LSTRTTSGPRSKAHAKARRGVGRPGDGEDVRGTILAAALRQLEAAGSSDRVTVSAIIAEAGCTPPSLYYYWPTRELLLHEASELGWTQFRSSQTAAAAGRQDSHGDSDQNPNPDPDRDPDSDHDPDYDPDHDPDHDPVQRLRLRGRAYLDFALAKPSLFRVLFLEPAGAGPSEATAESGGHALQDAEAGQALRDLVEDVRAAMATGQFRAADPFTTALALWSAMHGVAALWAVTPGLPTDLAHAVGDLAQDAVLAGLAT